MSIAPLLRDSLQQQIDPHIIQSFRLPIDEQDIIQALPASVLVALYYHNCLWHIILTKRSPQLEHHPGQVSFVGGKRQLEDSSAAATALREAYEEIGLLPENVVLLGALHQHLIARKFLVTPFVGIISTLTIQRNHHEVEEIFFLPIDFLLDDQNCYPDIRAEHYHGYQFHFEQFEIWGGTASILLDLKNIIKNNVKIYRYFTQP